MSRWGTWILVICVALWFPCRSPAQAPAATPARTLAPPPARVNPSPTPARAPATTSAQAKSAQHRGHRKPAPKPLVLAPLPPGPLPQLPMDLLPAAPPKVHYQDGLLTIVAENSTLRDILNEVQKLTGASIDIPPSATERVVTRLGPGSPRDVLVSLLDGSSFNYVMLGSNSDPNAVTSVVLTAKPSGSTQGQSIANAYQPNQGYVAGQQAPFMAQQVPAQSVVQPVEANAEDQDPAADDNADQGQPDVNGAAQGQPTSQPGQPNAGPRTPEQILEMLRRSQQPPNALPNPQRPPEN